MKCRPGASRPPRKGHNEIGAFFLPVILGLAAGIFAAQNGPLQAGQKQFDAGQYAQAAATLASAAEQNPRDATLAFWLARCYFELQDYDHAIASAERAVRLAPQDSDYHLWLGRAYGRKAERAGWFSGFSLARKTRHEFEEAVRLNPGNIVAQHDLIEFYLQAPGIVGGGHDKARRQVEALAAVDPVEGHVARGEYWMERKKPELAEQEYRQALSAKPKRVDPYLKVAEFFLKRNNATGMEEAFEAARQVDAGDRRLSYYCGVVRVLAGNRLDEAEQCLNTYLASVPPRSDLPSQADAHEWLGHLYERQGKCSAAAEQYHRALETDPRSKGVREALRHVQECAKK